MTEPTEQKPVAPPKKDKFASMAAAAAAPAPKRDKFASMAAVATTPPTSQPAQTQSKEQAHESLQKRLAQRNQVLKDLQQAEGWTWQLMCLARNTTRSLSDVSKAENAHDEISHLSKQYRDTLEQIHSLLSPHASLVKAYQNHSVDKKMEEAVVDSADNKSKTEMNMYAARVEMRLAKERRDVLQELLRLEQQQVDSSKQETSSSAGEKRKRQD